MAIKPERLLVSAILLHRNKEVLIKLNFGPENMVQYGEELQYLLALKRIPSTRTFKAKFPDFRIAKVDPTDLPQLVDLCRSNKVRRDLLLSLRKATNDVRNGEKPEKIATTLEHDIRKVNNLAHPTTDVDVLNNTELFLDIYKERRKKVKKGKIIGIPYGIASMDKVTGGMQENEMITVAARTSVGKTFLMCRFAASALVSGDDVAYFSLEMTWDQIASRIFTILSHDIQKGDVDLAQIIFNSKINLGQLSTKKVQRLLKEIKSKIKGNLWVPDIVGKFSISQAGRKIEQLNPRVVFFDYFGLAVSDGGKIDNWVQASESSNNAKEIARTYSLPFVIGAQLNRTGSTAPKIEHIAITDSIGQDSDKVYMLTRRRNNRLQVHCQKFRGGMSDWRVLLNWNVDMGMITESRFVSASNEEDE